MREQEEILTIDEVVSLLKIAKQTIYNMVHNKEIPHFKPTQRVLRFKRSEVLEWFEASRVKTTEQIKAGAKAA